MENEKKEETEKLDRAKALASAIKGGDEQLAQDCLDFADFPPEVRKEALERCKAGKCDKKDGEKDATDKAPNAAKDDADVPTPPDLPKPEDGKPPAESPAPASATASAPAPTPEPEAKEPAPTEVKSPANGENPADGQEAQDKAPKAEAHVCDKCGCDPCTCAKEGDKPAEDKAAKDCGTGVTEPSAPTPVAALQGGKEDEKKEDDDATGLLVDVSEVPLSTETPTPSAADIANGNTDVAALPVKAVRGLYYQASWGENLGEMTPGQKVQATGQTLNLGVIKQTGQRGFYKVSVSEQ